MLLGSLTDLFLIDDVFDCDEDNDDGAYNSYTED